MSTNNATAKGAGGITAAGNSAAMHTSIQDSCKTLLKSMADTWMEITTSSLSSTDNTALEHLVLVINCTQLVVRYVKMQSHFTTSMQMDILAYLVSVLQKSFPVSGVDLRNNPVGSLLLMRSNCLAGIVAMEANVSTKVDTEYYNAVSAFICTSLTKKVLMDAVGGGSTTSVDNRHLWNTLLHLCEKTIVNLLSHERRVILDALMVFNTESNWHSYSKGAIVQFFARSVAMKSRVDDSDLIPLSIMQSWLLTLPKLVWHLGTKSLNTTNTVLKIILGLFQKGAIQKEMTLDFIRGFIPFFYTQSKSEKDVFGPFVDLPVDVQMTALNILWYACEFPSLLLRALSVCASVPKVASPSRRYIIDLVHHVRETIGLPLQLSFIVSILASADKFIASPPGGAGTAGDVFEDVAASIANAIGHIDLNNHLIELLAPSLLALLEGGSASRHLQMAIVTICNHWSLSSPPPSADSADVAGRHVPEELRSPLVKIITQLLHESNVSTDGDDLSSRQQRRCYSLVTSQPTLLVLLVDALRLAIEGWRGNLEEALWASGIVMHLMVTSKDCGNHQSRECIVSGAAAITTACLPSLKESPLREALLDLQSELQLTAVHT
jgi:hypothetical protein